MVSSKATVNEPYSLLYLEADKVDFLMIKRACFVFKSVRFNQPVKNVDIMMLCIL